ncbi:MAG: nucleoside-diphosphate sugar epimerase/dehydratase [Halothiobacillaceae bacterium]
MNLNPRTFVIILHDIAVAALAWLGAYWLRFNLNLPAAYQAAALSTLIWVVPLQALVFWRFGLYRGIWRFASLPDLKRIVIAVGFAAMLIPVVLILLRVEEMVPRSVLLLDPLLLVALMGGSRFAYRAWKDHRLAAGPLTDTRPVLVLGAGSAADFLLRELRRTPSGYRPVGLLDDDPSTWGRLIQGIPVLGATREVQHWAQRLSVCDVILAMPSAPHAVRARLTDECAGLGLNLLTVPSMEDLMQGRVQVAALRPIELEDLLGRDPVRLDDTGLSDCLSNRVVMVTGAGGSIGSELCRQIARFKPSLLLLFEQSEFALYRLDQEFQRDFPNQTIARLIGDVQDARRIKEVLARFRPAVIYHAAAYKHVPLMEENALQALRNNVFGTWVLASEARAAGVEKFVMVSTDKAVHPTNVMGASKRMAEMVCQFLQAPPGEEGTHTRFISVRFGNVLGSSGSVIPKFLQQIEAGGPVTVTHPEITRYFMSIPEAAQLVLQAGLMGQGGEIFVLDMGEPVRIVDLARLMIRLAGKREDEIRIEFTGLRPGEKLYEELLADSESTLPTPHPKLRVARARAVDGHVVEDFLDWIRHVDAASDAEIRARLTDWLPGEYRANDQNGSAPQTTPSISCPA